MGVEKVLLVSDCCFIRRLLVWLVVWDFVWMCLFLVFVFGVSRVVLVGVKVVECSWWI